VRTEEMTVEEILRWRFGCMRNTGGAVIDFAMIDEMGRRIGSRRDEWDSEIHFRDVINSM
jgi:hypothetical protein